MSENPFSLSGNNSILIAFVLLVREAVGLVVRLITASVARTKLDRQEDTAHEDAAYARLDKLTTTLQGEIEKLKTALDGERAERERADATVRALRQELAEMRLALARAGCVVQECLKSGRCVRDVDGPLIHLPAPGHEGL
jgi:multidrug resistance efflux pump